MAADRRPRAIAAFGVAFAAVLLLNINNMWPHFELLFTDEGLFMTDSARQSLAGRQFRGYGEGLDGEPRGFFDLAAVLQWLAGRRFMSRNPIYTSGADSVLGVAPFGQSMRALLRTMI